MNNENTNESTFANFRRELQTLNYAELNYLISDIMLEIKKRSYNEGMVKAMTSGISAESVTTVSDQQGKADLSRDEIIEKAIEDITDNLVDHDGDVCYGSCEVKYVVNKEKRTIVAIVRGIASGKIRSRGIAKCDPSDCFNVHIGKAIALRRALGLEVPSEYLNAPQPTEVRVGDIIRWKTGSLYRINKVNGTTYDFTFIEQDEECNGIEYKNLLKYSVIIDDSRANNVVGGDANGEG